MKNLSDMYKTLNCTKQYDISDYLDVYNECYNALIEISNENKQQYINEGLGDWISSMSSKLNGLLTPIKNSLGEKSEKEEDTRSEYEKALDEAYKKKYETKVKQREQLMALKDKLKAQAVKTKSALEISQMELAHKQMSDALNAQLNSLKKQEAFWKSKQVNLSEDELLAQTNNLESQINKLEGKEKSDYERKRDIITATLFVKDGETGQLRMRKPEEIKKFIDENSAVKNELNKVAKDVTEKLNNLSSEDAKQLANQYCTETQAALNTTPAALDAEQGKINLEQAKVDAANAILNSKERKEKEKKYQDFKDKVDEYKELKTLANAAKNDPTAVLNDLIPKGETDGEEVKKAVITKLKKLGFDEEAAKKVADNITENNDDGTYVFDDEKKYNDFKDALNSKVTTVETALEDEAKELDIKKGENGDYETPEPKITKEEAEAAAKAFYSPKEPTREEISKFEDVNTAKGEIEAKKEEIKKGTSEINKKRKEFEEMSEKQQRRISETLTDVGRRAEEDADPDFKKEIDKSKANVNAGAVYKDGKLGYYDKDDKFIEAPKVNADDEESQKKRAEWERDKTLAMINPGEKQKEAMLSGLNTRIKLSKDADGNVKYIKQTKGDDGTWMDGDTVKREEALRIQKEHEQSNIADGIQKDIKKAAEEGDDFENLKSKYPALKELSDEEINKVAEKDLSKKKEATSKTGNSDDDSFETEDGTKYYIKDGKYYMETSDGDKSEVDKEDWEKEKENAVDDEKEGDERIDNNDDLVDDDEEKDEKTGEVTKSSTKDPKKVWKRRTYKRGDKTFKTKSYYNKNGKSISAKDFKEKVKKYEEKQKNKTNNESHITVFLKNKNFIIESFNPKISLIDFIKD